MFTTVLIGRPGGLDAARADSLRRALRGGPLRWLSPGEAAEFDHEATARGGEAPAGCDIATLPAADRRKRLLIADMDSTMIGQECVDELAAVAGVGDRVAAITERAMAGEIGFAGALRERVALLSASVRTPFDKGGDAPNGDRTEEHSRHDFAVRHEERRECENDQETKQTGTIAHTPFSIIHFRLKGVLIHFLHVGDVLFGHRQYPFSRARENVFVFSQMFRMGHRPRELLANRYPCQLFHDQRKVASLNLPFKRLFDCLFYTGRELPLVPVSVCDVPLDRLAHAPAPRNRSQPAWHAQLGSMRWTPGHGLASSLETFHRTRLCREKPAQRRSRAGTHSFRSSACDSSHFLGRSDSYSSQEGQYHQPGSEFLVYRALPVPHL
jgi:hypothetical protein